MLKVAWFSPVSKNRLLKSSVFSRLVLPILAQNWTIDIFVDDLELSELALEDSFKRCEDRYSIGIKSDTSDSVFSVQHYLRAYHSHSINPYDLFVYHIEDSFQLSYARRSLHTIPGISVFYDLNLNQQYLCSLIHSTGANDINNQMDSLFGKDSARLGDWHVRGWSIEVFDNIYRRGQNDFQAADLAIVFNGFSRDGYLSSNKSTHQINFPVEVKPKRQIEKLRALSRKSLGIGSDEQIIGFAGLPSYRHRASQTIKAFFDLLKTYNTSSPSPVRIPKFFWFLPSSEAIIEAKKIVDCYYAIAPELDNYLKLVSFTTATDFFSFLSAVDIFVSLDFDSHRSSVLPIVHLLSIGIPCLISASGSNSEIPEDVAIHVRLGSTESMELKLWLKELLENNELRSELGQNAINYAENELSPVAAAEHLMKIFFEYQEFLLEKRLKNTEQYSNTIANIIPTISSADKVLPTIDIQKYLLDATAP